MRCLVSPKTPLPMKIKEGLSQEGHPVPSRQEIPATRKPRRNQGGGRGVRCLSDAQKTREVRPVRPFDGSSGDSAAAPGGFGGGFGGGMSMEDIFAAFGDIFGGREGYGGFGGFRRSHRRTAQAGSTEVSRPPHHREGDAWAI